MIRPNDGGSIIESQININDVLCGRGTKHCNQPGNMMYHTLVRTFIVDYAKAKKKNDKTEISKAIVSAIRNASPGGRFLNKGSDGYLHEIGDKKAWEKTSQLLRETVMMGSHRTMYQKRKWDEQRKKQATSPTSVEQDINEQDRKMSPPPMQKTKTTRESGVSCRTCTPRQHVSQLVMTSPSSSSSPSSAKIINRMAAPNNVNASSSCNSSHLDVTFRSATALPYHTVAATGASSPPAMSHHPSRLVSRPLHLPSFTPMHHSRSLDVQQPNSHIATTRTLNLLDVQQPNSHIATTRTLNLPYHRELKNAPAAWTPAVPGLPLQASRRSTPGSGHNPISYVDRLRTELSSWPVQPSPATIAELEVIARYQDATYVYNNGNSANASVSGVTSTTTRRSPPHWGANH